jgi:hypothetical protein
MRRWQLGRGDIAPIRRPEISVESWQNSAAALEVLREWAEQRTVETIDWYLRDKRARRRGSRLLRAAAVVLGVAGGVVPLVAGLTDAVDVQAGYVFLALAAGCLAFDHFFGVSSGWMRDITTSQALQGSLTRFHLRWAAWQARESGVLKAADEQSTNGTAEGLMLIEALVKDVLDATDRETAQWLREFSAAVVALRRQTGGSGPAVGSHSTEESTVR